jgi:glycosyltransferase involved in cell wall biosynthesis
MSKVSIILPSYNHNSFLKDRLDSIVNQTFKDWELIIIDDKSSDGSIETLKEFYQKYTNKISNFIINTENSGSGYKSWKKGIELAQSEYIWIAETDDYSDVSFLEEQVKILDTYPKVALTFCASNYVDANKTFLYNTNKRTLDLSVSENNSKLFKGEVYLNKAPFDTYITNGSSVVYRKPKIDIPNLIFENKQSSDIFLWTFLMQNSSFVFLNKKLNFFRRHEGSTTTRLSSLRKLDIFQENIKYLHFYKQKNKDHLLLKKYFQQYVWINKKEIFNTKIFDFNLTLKYYLFLIPNICVQLINKIEK